MNRKLTAGIALLSLSTMPAMAERVVIASDMVNSTSLNLISHDNPLEDNFSSAGDTFQKLQRGFSPSIPFAISDDSISVFPADTLGIIDETDLQVFFGAVDVENSNNTSGVGIASWTFDIANTPDIEVAIDMAAMGDFETDDEFFWTASIDGGDPVVLFESTVDQDIDHSYALASGTTVTLNDPMLVDGVILTNEMQTFNKELTSTGNQLTLTLTLAQNGGSEAIAFRNIEISHRHEESVVAFDMVGSAESRLVSHDNSYENSFSSAGDTFQKLQRSVSPVIPFSLSDDSLGVFVGDTLGIIDETDNEVFFGVVDVNNVNNPNGTATASWTFDVLGAEQLGLSIDMAAMGDFELADNFIWTASIDGGEAIALFGSTVDETIDNTYTLASGSTITLNDPMLVDDVVLTNEMQTFRQAIDGEGSELTLTLTVTQDGGSEAIAFRDLLVIQNFQEIDNDPVDPIDPEYVAVFIHEIQGSTLSSVMVDALVEITGIVTADFQDGDIAGYFVQEETIDFDADPLTSEGIFVYEGISSLVNVNVGDKVTIRGAVSESFGETQLVELSSVSVIESNTLEQTTRFDVTLPSMGVITDSAGIPVNPNLEPYEGMWVQLPQTLTITELFDLDRFGELRLSQGGRLYQFTQLNEASETGYLDHLTDITMRSILLDDGSSQQNPDPIPFLIQDEEINDPIRMGDEITNLTGILRYSFGNYRIVPTETPEFVRVISRPERPNVGGSLSVASFNVLNFFNTLDVSGSSCYQDGSFARNNCRGADSIEEYDRQLAKTVTALVALNADIIGLIEIENDYTDGQNSAISALTSAMNSVLDGIVDGNHLCTNYTFVSPTDADSGELVRIGTDAIAVGLLYCSDTVKIADNSVPAILDDAAVDAFELGFSTPLFNGVATNRAALATTFTELASNESLTIAVNHFKSKGSSGLNSDSVCINTPEQNLNCDQQNGQGYWNERRTIAANAVNAWLDKKPTGSDDPDKLIMGDINAYKEESPLKALESAGFLNVIPDGSSYSYVFDGQVGSLDHGLASSSLFEQLTSAVNWNINADEADAIDYNLDFSSAKAYLFDPSVPYRSSDHDPVIMGFDLNSATNPVIGDYDGDGDVDILDIRALIAAYQLGLEIDLSFDLNEDGVVNILDIRLIMRTCTRAGCAVG